MQNKYAVNVFNINVLYNANSYKILSLLLEDASACTRAYVKDDISPIQLILENFFDRFNSFVVVIYTEDPAHFRFRYVVF